MKLSFRYGKTVKELQQQIDSQEFSELVAYDRITPIGDERVDILFAMLQRTIAQCNATKGHKFKCEDFLAKWFERPLTVEERIERMKDAAMRITLLNGGDISQQSDNLT